MKSRKQYVPLLLARAQVLLRFPLQGYQNKNVTKISKRSPALWLKITLATTLLEL